jgi:KUP system potassium uptake protein
MTDKTSNADGNNFKYLIGISLAALGVVFGDIGTSPLYALRECFFGAHPVPISPDNVLGVLSLIIWALIVLISIDYLLVILRADNNGEGGEFALLALLSRIKRPARTAGFILIAGLAGAALLYGDGMITPAISVLSAVEGLEVILPGTEQYVPLIAVIILAVLFWGQARGTARMGALFGPVILIWFTVLAILGLRGVMVEPAVLKAINPLYGINFILEYQFQSFWVLGSVFLVVTGGEALFADMGHFGRQPIRIAWFSVVFPALILNYLGQGALLLNSQEMITNNNPFFSLAPAWGVLPLVILATAATVVASQALISGAFSLTRQAIQLGYLPRMEIRHTSADEIGQIYVPVVNWGLFVANIWLVTEFRSSGNLAAAYGFAVATSMVITTMLMFFVARDIWKWPMKIAGIGWALILTIKLAFFSAAVIKIPSGGWVPLVVGAAIMLLMTTWRRGRQIVAERLRSKWLPLPAFIAEVHTKSTTRVPGTAVFLARSSEGTPTALVHNLLHNKVLHEKVIILTIETDTKPISPVSESIEIQDLGIGIHQVTAKYGFMQTPHVPRLMKFCKDLGLQFTPEDATFFLGRETLIPSERPGMALWREGLFAFMARNAQRAMNFFRIPPDRVVEIGVQVEL